MESPEKRVQLLQPSLGSEPPDQAQISFRRSVFIPRRNPAIPYSHPASSHHFQFYTTPPTHTAAGLFVRLRARRDFCDLSQILSYSRCVLYLKLTQFHIFFNLLTVGRPCLFPPLSFSSLIHAQSLPRVKASRLTTEEKRQMLKRHPRLTSLH